MKIKLCNVTDFTDVCMVGGQSCAPHQTNLCKILQLCGEISLLSLDISPSNLVNFLILRPSLQKF